MPGAGGVSRSGMGQVTQKQARFVEEYLLLGNASEAYRRAYSPEKSSIYCAAEAHELLKHPEISRMVEAKRKESADRAAMTLDRMLERLRLVIECDPAELSTVQRGACRHCWGEGFAYQWREPDYWEECTRAERAANVSGRKKGDAPPLPDIAGGFGYNATKKANPDCPKCDGVGLMRTHIPDMRELSDAARAAYLGVKETRNGIEIQMMSKEKAVELYGRFSGWSDVNIRLGVEAGLLSDAVRAETSDPNEAARQYRRMLDATG